MRTLHALLKRPFFECDGEIFTWADLLKVALGMVAFFFYVGLAQAIIGE